jgi:hypothetical protein
VVHDDDVHGCTGAGGGILRHQAAAAIAMRV